MKVRLLHKCVTIPGSRWCEPIDWQPANDIPETIWVDGAWWDDTSEVAGVVCAYVVDDGGEEGSVVDADLDNLLVVRSFSGQVIGRVTVDN